MLMEKIEELQDILNIMIDSENIGYDTILKVSQQLDELIVEYQKEIGDHEFEA